jgi:hypothetical protein
MEKTTCSEDHFTSQTYEFSGFNVIMWFFIAITHSLRLLGQTAESNGTHPDHLVWLVVSRQASEYISWKCNSKLIMYQSRFITPELRGLLKNMNNTNV